MALRSHSDDDSFAIGIYSSPLPTSPYPLPPFSPSLISLMVSVDVKHHVYLLTYRPYFRAQELCESRGGRPGLPSLISLRFL